MGNNNMPRKELLFKTGTTYFGDPTGLPKDIKKQSWLRYILVRLLQQMGVPVIDPCCPSTGQYLPLAWDSTANRIVAWKNGSYVPVETAAGLSTTTSTTTTGP